ncbi:MAG: acylneuraminate cytidylyltransferase family protein [Paenibacillaceae bacterium]
MINGKTILALIPARGGSKGVIRKNIRNIAGKPLMAWTIEAAKKSKYIDRLVLSSEDAEIINVALKWGCEAPFVRPEYLALDETPGIEPVIHAINTLPRYDYVVLLQPTSPLRSTADIDGCIEMCLSQSANACVSVTEPDKSPYWMYTLDDQNMMKPLLNKDQGITRRQDLPLIVALNGAIYIAKSDWLLNKKSFVSHETIAYLMPKNRSIDVDTELDLLLIEFILKQSY